MPKNVTEIQAVFAVDEAQALLFETGYKKALVHLTMEEKSAISSVLVNYHCMMKQKAAMDQFIEGLESPGVT